MFLEALYFFSLCKSSPNSWLAVSQSLPASILKRDLVLVQSHCTRCRFFMVQTILVQLFKQDLKFTLIFLPKFLLDFLLLYLQSFSLRSSELQLLAMLCGLGGDCTRVTSPLPSVCHKNSLSMTLPYTLWKSCETSIHFLVHVSCHRTNKCLWLRQE